VPLNPIPLIVKKRDGGALSRDEIRGLVDGFVSGDVTDYQMSAFLMAALLRGMDDAETVALTDAMLHSGRVLALPSVNRTKVDKHSTGGVGDKISICLAPAVAACGLAVPMISGRGLGHTGGTLDKLESIPGYRTRLDAKAFERVVAKVGVSMIGQTDDLAPADRRMYSLRDVTGTVESIPLIVASILSKKLACGLDGLVLDVKCGRGAFMKDLPSAEKLARTLVRVGRRSGTRASALITDMSAPTGTMIGNALEVREAIDVLRGGGPADTVLLTVELGAEMLMVARDETKRSVARARILRALSNGSGLDVFRKMVEAHGGDPRAVDDPARLPHARYRVPVLAGASGFVAGIDPLALGLLGVEMGAGRVRSDQSVDPAVGIELAQVRGHRIEKGEPLAFLHVHHDRPVAWVAATRAAFRISRARPNVPKSVLVRLSRRAS
jgi:pyrimidine-nucleoside phosphorylase